MPDCRCGVIRGPQYHDGERVEIIEATDKHGHPILTIFEANEYPDGV
jgi:hypothetical protein